MKHYVFYGNAKTKPFIIFNQFCHQKKIELEFKRASTNIDSTGDLLKGNNELILDMRQGSHGLRVSRCQDCRSSSDDYD